MKSSNTTGIRRRIPLFFLALSCSLAGQQDRQPTYTISTVAGGTFAGDGGAATSAILVQPEGIAVDARGNVYVADAGDHRVRRISPDGIIRTIAGDGTAGFRGDGGPAEQSQLSAPYGLCLDSAGNLYIADLGNARIRKISPDGKISTVAGGGSVTPGGSVEGHPATEARFSTPRNVAVDGLGNRYI
ncbi:MAG: hypothetical protein ACRD7E_25575, partial [Bryobacteraceae bacterium]